MHTDDDFPVPPGCFFRLSTRTHTSPATGKLCALKRLAATHAQVTLCDAPTSTSSSLVVENSTSPRDPWSRIWHIDDVDETSPVFNHWLCSRRTHRPMILIERSEKLVLCIAFLCGCLKCNGLGARTVGSVLSNSTPGTPSAVLGAVCALGPMAPARPLHTHLAGTTDYENLTAVH
jgi:hypothetical protein